MNEYIKQIFQTIKIYSSAYTDLENIQEDEKEKNETERLLPIGDQKTGVIGEFYAMLYAREKYKSKKVVFAPMKEPFDLIVGQKEILIQVKTISDFSQNQKVILKGSSVKNKFILYLVHLNKNFEPIYFGEKELEFSEKKRSITLNSVKNVKENNFTEIFLKILEEYTIK
jgi:hypothetical protein